MSSPLVEKVVDGILAGRGAPNPWRGFVAGPKLELDPRELFGEVPETLYLGSDRSSGRDRVICTVTRFADGEMTVEIVPNVDNRRKARERGKRR